MKNVDYNNFELEDFVNDDFFVQSINQPTEETIKFWSAWQKNNHNKKQIIDEARSFVKNIIFDVTPTPDGKIEELFTNISASIIQPETITTRLPSNKPISIWSRKLVAAMLIGLLGIGTTYFFYFSKVVYQTTYGELEQIELRDGSTVTLHGNSTLEIQKYWSKNDTRELYFDGEGIFEITQTPINGSRKCIIKTPVGAVVEVQGTTFTVNTWKNEVCVVLTEGNINFITPKVTDKVQEFVKMVPGEKITYAKKELSKEINVNTDVYNSWKNNKFTFDNTPIRDVINIIENVYGYKMVVNVDDEDFLDKKIGGTFSDDFSTLLKSLALVLGVNFEQLEGKQIVINK